MTYKKCPKRHAMRVDLRIQNVRWWCDACEKYYVMTEKEKNIFYSGFEFGVEVGKSRIQCQMRNALGV